MRKTFPWYDVVMMCLFFSVCHRQRKNILLCIMDIARLASRFGIEPPGLVTLEKEIEREEAEVFKVPEAEVFKMPMVPDKKPITNGSGKHRDSTDSVSLNGSGEFGAVGNGSVTPKRRTPTKIPGPRRNSRTPTPTRSPTPTRIPTPTQSPRRPSSSGGQRRRSSSSTSSAKSEDLDQKVLGTVSMAIYHLHENSMEIFIFYHLNCNVLIAKLFYLPREVYEIVPETIFRGHV